MQVLRRFAMNPPSGIRLIVVLDRPVAVYSGMVPGFVAGDYTHSDLEIDIVPLARRAGASVILSPATDVDPVRKTVSIEGRPAIRFDLMSLDVGSTVRGLDLPGVQEHALSTRPIASFVHALEAHLARLRALGRPAKIAVVGGGADLRCGGVQRSVGKGSWAGRSSCGVSQVRSSRWGRVGGYKR